jgi:hypothetical protein
MARRLSERRWIDHSAAVARFSAVWEAFEALRLKKAPGWRSDWWLRHVDPHLAVLFDGESGLFFRCGDGHHAATPLPVASGT